MKTFLEAHPFLVLIAIFIVTTIAIALRRDRGAIIFKKRDELLPEEKTLYYFFHILKYVVAVFALINLGLRLKIGIKQ